MQTSIPVAMIVAMNAVRYVGATVLVFFAGALYPHSPAQVEEFLKQSNVVRPYRPDGGAFDIFPPLLSTATLIGLTLFLFVVVGTLLIRLYRWKNLAGFVGLLSVVSGAVPGFLIVLAVLIFGGSLASALPQEGPLLKTFPLLELVLPAIALILCNFGKLSSMCEFQAQTAGTFSDDLLYASAVTLQEFPATIVTGMIIIEAILNYPGLGFVLVKATPVFDLPVIREIAISAIILVVACRLIGDLMCRSNQRAMALRNPDASVTKALLRSPLAWLGCGLVLTWVVLAAMPDTIASYDPARNNFSAMLEPPGGDYLLGTDAFGRDILAGVVHGGQRTVFIALIVAAITVSAGFTFPLLRQMLGTSLSIFTSSITTLPLLVLLLIFKVTFFFSTGVFAAILTLVYLARLYEIFDRGNMQMDENRHMWSRMSVAAALRDFAYLVGIVLAVDALRFGPVEPNVNWGLMINLDPSYFDNEAWLTVMPAAAAVSLMLGFTLLAYGIERHSSTRSAADEA